MASPVYLWYTSELYFWRSLASSCWSIIFLPFFLFLYLLLSSISLTHPIGWIIDAVINVLSFKFTFVVLFFGASMILVTWFSLPYFSVKPTIESSKLASLLGLFRWSRLTLYVICMLNGVLAGWSVSHLAGPEFDSLSKDINNGGREALVLNERHMFIVGCGLFAGFCHFCQFFWQKKYHLIFPNIHEDYLSLGYTIPLDYPLSLLDLRLAWQTFLTVYLITYTWSVALTLTKIFHTERFELPIISVIEDMKDKTLADALACSYSPMLQYLAFLDLAWLTKFSPSRVQELLSLSQPGGHPKIWVTVSELVLNEIWKLTATVREANLTILSKVSVNPHQNGVSHTSTHGHFESVANSSIHFRGPEPMSESSVGRENEIPANKGLITKLFQSSSRLPVLSQLFIETPDTNSQHLFAGCQLQIWAVESLSHIADRAYTEDQYGIVQGSLPVIFSTFLDLNESMEKHFKLTPVASRRHNGCDTSCETMLWFKLHSVLKSALYRMVNTYRPHLNDLYLSTEEVKKLSPFIEYTA